MARVNTFTMAQAQLLRDQLRRLEGRLRDLLSVQPSQWSQPWPPHRQLSGRQSSSGGGSGPSRSNSAHANGAAAAGPSSSHALPSPEPPPQPPAPSAPSAHDAL